MYYENCYDPKCMCQGICSSFHSKVLVDLGFVEGGGAEPYRRVIGRRRQPRTMQWSLPFNSCNVGKLDLTSLRLDVDWSAIIDNHYRG